MLQDLIVFFLDLQPDVLPLHPFARVCRISAAHMHISEEIGILIFFHDREHIGRVTGPRIIGCAKDHAADLILCVDLMADLDCEGTGHQLMMRSLI